MAAAETKALLLFSLFALAFLMGCAQQQEQSQENQLLIMSVNDSDNGTIVQTTDRDIERIVGNEPQATPEPEPEAPGLIVYTDRQNYKSRERMNITVNISSTSEIGNVTLLLHGIENIRGQEFLNEAREVTVSGDATENLEHLLPYCSSCSGMPRGTYTIYAEARQGNETLATANCSFNFSS